MDVLTGATSTRVTLQRINAVIRRYGCLNGSHLYPCYVTEDQCRNKTLWMS